MFSEFSIMNIMDINIYFIKSLSVHHRQVTHSIHFTADVKYEVGVYLGTAITGSCESSNDKCVMHSMFSITVFLITVINAYSKLLVHLIPRIWKGNRVIAAYLHRNYIHEWKRNNIPASFELLSIILYYKCDCMKWVCDKERTLYVYVSCEIISYNLSVV